MGIAAHIGERVHCAQCRTPLLEVVNATEWGGIIKADDFKGIDGYPDPQNHEPPSPCIKCGYPLTLVRIAYKQDW